MALSIAITVGYIVDPQSLRGTHPGGSSRRFHWPDKNRFDANMPLMGGGGLLKVNFHLDR